MFPLPVAPFRKPLQTRGHINGDRDRIRSGSNRPGSALSYACLLARRRAWCGCCLDTASCPRGTSIFRRAPRPDSIGTFNIKVEPVAVLEVRGVGASLRRRSEAFETTVRRFQLQVQSATPCEYSQIQIFNLSNLREINLLGTALKFVIQNDGLRDVFHGFAHLLALFLHRAVGFFLTESHPALHDSLGALHELARF